LFIRPAEPGPGSLETARRQGCNVVRWTADRMSLWVMSDIEANRLRESAEARRRIRD